MLLELTGMQRLHSPADRSVTRGIGTCPFQGVEAKDLLRSAAVQRWRCDLWTSATCTHSDLHRTEGTTGPQ